MAITKPLGRDHHGLDFKKAGDVLARCVCRGRITQSEANKFANELIKEAGEGKHTTEEDLITRTCQFAGIGRQFAGV